VETSASFALVTSYGGYTTNLPLEDLTDHKAWIAFRYDGEDLEPEHGGPARRSRRQRPQAPRTD
jgi:DMSO/TMAO reductase YedYZ molybdopterin-dependent catalytic subunit